MLGVVESLNCVFLDLHLSILLITVLALRELASNLTFTFALDVLTHSGLCVVDSVFPVPNSFGYTDGWITSVKNVSFVESSASF